MASTLSGYSLGIDLEAFSELNIKKVGGHKYCRHPSTELLILRGILDDPQGNREDEFRWLYGEPMPRSLFRVIARGVRLRAFNAAFESQMFIHVLAAKMGWPLVDIEQWYCTQAAALRHALPMSLDKCAAVFNKVHKKLESGTRLINKFSKPKTNGGRNYPCDFPEEFEEFDEYCGADVEAEREVYWNLPYREFSDDEREFWIQLQHQNAYGVCVDIPTVKAMIKMLHVNKTRQTQRVVELTDGAVTTINQRAKVLQWCDAQGYPLEGYTKEIVEKAVEDKKTPDNVRELLTIRQDLGQTAVAKYPTIITYACADRTIKGSLIYHRASTGRNGGSGPQFHNIPRDYIAKKDDLVELALKWVRESRYEDIELVFGSLMHVAKGGLRAVLIPRPGKIFYAGDFSSIENRVTVWIAQDEVGLDVFVNGVDQYRAFAAKQFGIEIDEVTDEQRTDAKATILGAMFGAGAKTIWQTNVKKGIPMTLKQAKTNVAEFREQYAVTAATWYELDEICIEACRLPIGKAIMYKGLKFFRREDFFFIQLHSGRKLAYYKADVRKVMTPWGKEKFAVTHMGQNSKGAWIRQTLTPSRIIENIVQAEARDLLMHSKREVISEGFDIVLDVHDEILSEQDPDYMEAKEYEHIMTRTPFWATQEGGAFVDFPLGVEAKKFPRYRK